jgi:uncharacterized protein (TIGR02452 family)
MTNNVRRKSIAQDTVALLEQGSYTAPSGLPVSLTELMQSCLAGTCGYLPEELAEIQAQVLAQQPPAFSETTFEVANETTLEAAARLASTGALTGTPARLGVLNFASARNPGGGFLGGAQAQEESLARSSGLYPSLLRCREHYDFHRAQRTCLYSDRIIYSPDCPVFRADDGDLLETPYLVDFLTCAAPNAGAIRRNEPENVRHIEPALRERSAKVLSLAAHQRCDVLVLGAWGCGVFQNDPGMVAEVFSCYLSAGAPFWGRFQRIVFAVLDRSPAQATFTAFRERFSQEA